jgi:NTF2 fold immunity protein
MVFGLLLSTSAFAQYVPPRGFVPNAETAIAVARAILIPIYGAENIKREEPLVAEERTDRWIVRGTLCPTLPPNSCLGGVAVVEIAKSDGRIVRVIRYQ